MFKVVKEIDSIEKFEPWSGAVFTYNTIRDEGKLDDLERLIEELYPDGIEEGKLNDLLWFESAWLYEQLGIKDEEDKEQEEKDDMIACLNDIYDLVFGNDHNVGTDYASEMPDSYIDDDEMAIHIKGDETHYVLKITKAEEGEK